MHTIKDLMPEINLIKSTEIRELVIRVLNETAPSYFWVVDSSSTNFFHPTVNGKPITLVDHTKATARALGLLLANPIISCRFTRRDIDLMLAASILHDVAKRGAYDDAGHTVHEHPILLSMLLPQPYSNNEYHLFSEIVEIAIAHTGPWTRSDKSEVVLPEIRNDKQYYVHIADYLVSRKILHIDLDNDDSMKYLTSNLI